MNTRKLRCDCQHKFQDKEYGNKIRLHNYIGNEKTPNNWRCTVCNKEK